jgi:hypothetical protein
VPGTISLKEFKATFSTVVCELELKYGANYTDVFAFKQLAHYVHYEALNVYKQHFPRILGVTQIPNPTYATTIAITSQAALQVTIAHHGIMPNNLDLVPTSVNLSPQQFIATTANILRMIDAATFADLVGNPFEFLSWNFRSRVLKKFYNSLPFLDKRMKPSKCSIGGFLSSKRMLKASQT